MATGLTAQHKALQHSNTFSSGKIHGRYMHPKCKKNLGAAGLHECESKTRKWYVTLYQVY